MTVIAATTFLMDHYEEIDPSFEYAPLMENIISEPPAEILAILLEAGEKLEVLSGLHRVAAAAKAGVGVAYVVDNNITDLKMLQVEVRGGNWSLLDFAYAHASCGNESYGNLIDFVDHHRIPVGVAAKSQASGAC